MLPVPAQTIRELPLAEVEVIQPPQHDITDELSIVDIVVVALSRHRWSVSDGDTWIGIGFHLVHTRNPCDAPRR